MCRSEKFAGRKSVPAGKVCRPENVPAGHMGILPSAIGWDPIIRLQAGSLKVAELMKTNETHYNNFELAQYL